MHLPLNQRIIKFRQQNKTVVDLHSLRVTTMRQRHAKRETETEEKKRAQRINKTEKWKREEGKREETRKVKTPNTKLPGNGRPEEGEKQMTFAEEKELKT